VMKDDFGLHLSVGHLRPPGHDVIQVSGLSGSSASVGNNQALA
jgi:hypothetical protein